MSKYVFPRNVANVLDNFYEYHESTEVNTLMKCDPTLWHGDMSLKSKWLIEHFYQPRKIEFKVHTLQNITQFQLMSNLIMKTLIEFCLRATDNIQVEIPQILESQKYYFTMKKSFQKYLEQFLPGRQKKGSKDEMAYHITKEQLSFIKHKAMDYPLEMTLRLLRERLPWSLFIIQ